MNLDCIWVSPFVCGGVGFLFEFLGGFGLWTCWVVLTVCFACDCCLFDLAGFRATYLLFGLPYLWFVVSLVWFVCLICCCREFVFAVWYLGFGLWLGFASL